MYSNIVMYNYVNAYRDMYIHVHPQVQCRTSVHMYMYTVNERMLSNMVERKQYNIYSSKIVPVMYFMIYT